MCRTQDYCWSLAEWRLLPIKLWRNISVYKILKTDATIMCTSIVRSYCASSPTQRHWYEEPHQEQANRTSFNHLSKSLRRKNEDLLLPTSSIEMETIPNFEEADDHLGSARSSWTFLKLKRFILLKEISLDMTEDQYNPSERTYLSTGAVRGVQAGIFIKHTDERLTSKSFPTGKIWPMVMGLP